MNSNFKGSSGYIMSDHDAVMRVDMRLREIEMECLYQRLVCYGVLFGEYELGDHIISCALHDVYFLQHLLNSKRMPLLKVITIPSGQAQLNELLFQFNNDEKKVREVIESMV